MTDEDAHGFLLALLKSFGKDGLDRAALIRNLAGSFPTLDWEERFLHAEAVFIRSEPGPALPDWLR